jgi:hypothetical protein
VFETAAFNIGVVVDPCTNFPPGVVCVILVVDPTARVLAGALPVACVIADFTAAKSAVELAVRLIVEVVAVVPVPVTFAVEGDAFGVVAIKFLSLSYI